MTIPSEVYNQLKIDCVSQTSKYWHCARDCKHYLLQELRASDWYIEEIVRGRVTTRVKPLKKIVQKLERKNKEADSIDELEGIITDIVGGRVVLDHIDHAEKMASRLEEFPNWSIIKSEPIRRDDGYHAVRHIDVLIQTPRDGKVRSEIQVLTLIQHAWLVISHPIYEVVRNVGQKHQPPEIIKDTLRNIGYNLHAADLLGVGLVKAFEDWKEVVDV